MYLKRLGIAVKFVDAGDLAAFENAIDEETKAIYVESIGNPKYNVAPIPELAAVRLDLPSSKLPYRLKHSSFRLRISIGFH